MGIKQGTTPMIKIRTSFDLTDYDVFLTLRQDAFLITVNESRLTKIRDTIATYLSVTLTQQETLQFNYGDSVEIQFKARLKKSVELIVIASEIAVVDVTEILDQGAIK